MSTHEKLCEALRVMDTSTMTTAAVLDACMAVAPDAEFEDVAAALRQVGEEHQREAEALRLYGRTRRAGITRVVEGGKS